MKRFEEWQLSQLPETVHLPADIQGEVRAKIESHLGDKLKDRAFMFQLRAELRRIGAFKEEDISVLEATLIGFITGQADLHQFFDALSQSHVVLLTRPEKPGIPLAVEHEDGNPYLAVFTSLEKAILAVDYHEPYRRPGNMIMLDVMDIFFDQLGLKQLGLWINPYDRVLTFRFDPEQALAFSKDLRARRETPSEA